MTEHQIQAQFFKWWKQYNLQKGYVCFAIPNGNVRDIITAKNLQREGVTAGIVDVFLAVARKEHYGLFLEFKTPTGRLSKEQAVMKLALEMAGYKVEIVRSAEEAVKIVREYLG